MQFNFEVWSSSYSKRLGSIHKRRPFWEHYVLFGCFQTEELGLPLQLPLELWQKPVITGIIYYTIEKIKIEWK